MLEEEGEFWGAVMEVDYSKKSVETMILRASLRGG
jgi:hypothetical protein